ncbi:hypothetical protein TWF506_006955 [Arthrobotrys conoides]|uniref:Uncharacterized protein n=1 Tax=Arthrobotrys conoides TaxID=74498 RepID=A0AAN8NUP3_9PEZI
MCAIIYYAVLAAAFLCSIVQALDLPIPFVRTNSVENLILDLQSLQKVIEMWADVIPSVEDTYDYVQEVINVATDEGNGIFGGNSIPSDDLARATEDIYNTLAAFEPPSGQQDPTEYNYLKHDPFYGIDLKKVFDFLRDWKPSDENPFPPPDPILATPEMRSLVAEVRERERAEENYRRQNMERNLQGLPGQNSPWYPGMDDDYGDGTGPYDYQDMLSTVLQDGDQGILDHKVGPMDFDYQPSNSRSGAMEEEIVDTTTNSAPLNMGASTGQFNTAFNGPFDTMQNYQASVFNGLFDTTQMNQMDAFNRPVDTISIPQVNAVSNKPADMAYDSLGQVDIASTTGINTQATTGPAQTASTTSLDAIVRGVPVNVSPWSSFDSNAPPPTQPSKPRTDRNEIRRNRKAALAAGVNPSYDPGNGNVDDRRMRTLKKSDATQTQGDNPQGNLNSNSKRRLQLNFRA